VSQPRDHKAAYARRQERARALGFTGYRQLRTAGGNAVARLTGRTAWSALPADAQRSRDTALRVLAEMRATGAPLSAASARHDTTPDAVRFWAGPALSSRRSDTATARPADRLYRPMRALTDDGIVAVDLRGSKAAGTLGAYWNAVHHYLTTGDTGLLDRFRDVRVGGITLTTDPRVLDHHAHIGELAFESIYAAAA